MDVGKNIRIIRDRANLTQTELGKKVGKTKQWVSNVETGKTRINIEMMYAISEALGCSITDVLPSGPDTCDDPTDYDVGMMLRSSEIAHEQMQKQVQNTPEPALSPVSESLLRKRESVKTLVDVLDEEQLEVLMRLFATSLK